MLACVWHQAIRKTNMFLSLASSILQYFWKSEYFRDQISLSIWNLFHPFLTTQTFQVYKSVRACYFSKYYCSWSQYEVISNCSAPARREERASYDTDMEKYLASTGKYLELPSSASSSWRELWQAAGLLVMVPSGLRHLLLYLHFHQTEQGQNIL